MAHQFNKDNIKLLYSDGTFNEIRKFEQLSLAIDELVDQQIELRRKLEAKRKARLYVVIRVKDRMRQHVEKVSRNLTERPSV